MNMIRVLFLTLACLALSGIPTYAQETEEPASTSAVIYLSDGSIIRGMILAESADSITVDIIGGQKLTLSKSVIVRMEIGEIPPPATRFRNRDPNYSRLLFAPTGRPLKRGHWYIVDTWVFFPGFAVGITDNIGLLAGISIIPAVNFEEQLKYIAPKIGFEISDDFAFSVGALYTHVGDDVIAGMVYAVATAGTVDASASFGTGLGYTRDDGKFEFAEHPIMMLGGNVRLGEGVAIVSENWLITGDDFDLNEQPFSIGMRLFGQRAAGDIAFILIGEVLDEGFPIPWLSFTYNFGR